MFEGLGDSEGLTIFTLIQQLFLLCLSAEKFAILNRLKDTILDEVGVGVTSRVTGPTN